MNDRERVEYLIRQRDKIRYEIAALKQKIAQDERAAVKAARKEARQSAIRTRRAEVRPPTAYDKRRAAKCGSDSGYYRHIRKLNEKACADCKRAHAIAEAERVARKVNAQRGVAA